MNAPTEPKPEALVAEAAWLHRLARAMLRDPERAHDVAQETLVAALEHTPAHARRSQRSDRSGSA